MLAVIAAVLMAVILAWPCFAVAPRQQEGVQLYRDYCASCHGAEGNRIQGVDFRSGQFRRASSDDDLSKIIADGIPGTAMAPSNIPEMTRRAIVAYLRSMQNRAASSPGKGDTANGRLIVESKAGCLACHRVNGKGSRVGPDLSAIGALRSAGEIERSLLDPNATVLAQNRFIRALTREGAAVTGRRLNEDSDTVQIIDDREQLLSIPKSTLREFSILKTSPMPSFRDKLTAQELTDVVTYVFSLKGNGTQ